MRSIHLGYTLYMVHTWGGFGDKDINYDIGKSIKLLYPNYIYVCMYICMYVCVCVCACMYIHES